jgi:cytochrome bd-type quinol oxidase subunit 2
MTGLRVLKAVTAYAFLVLITTAWVYKFNAKGYSQTLDSLRASFGDLAYVFIAIFSVGSMLSTPILGIAGIVGMVASIRLGRSALAWGFLCCLLSLANFVLWAKYGGMPSKIPFCDWCNHP